MKVSVVMATYNGAEYVREQLLSFARQTRLPDELVVSDDGSTDRTLAIVEEFVSSVDFEVKILRNEKNLGYGRNFFQALSHCSGDWVFLSDQDDVWLPGKIATVLDAACEYPAAQVWMNDSIIADGELNDLGYTLLGSLRNRGSASRFFLHGSSAAVSAQFLRFALPAPVTMDSHDGWLMGLADCVGVRAVVDQPLQYWRRHGANESDFDGRAAWLGAAKELWGKLRSGGQASLDIRSSLERQQFMAMSMAGWADEQTAVGGEHRPLVECCRDVMRRRIPAIEARLALRDKPRLLRWVPIAVLFSKGGYGEFAGANTAVLDLLVP